MASTPVHPPPARLLRQARRHLPALREPEEEFRAIFDHALDGILVVDPVALCVKAANAAMEKLLGHAPGRMAGMALARLHPPEVFACVRQGVRSGTAQWVLDVPMCRQDGQIVHVDLSAAPAQIGGVRHMIATFRDATERRAGEQRLRALNRILKTLSAGNAVLVRATDEADLLGEMTRILHETGGYPLALVGYASDDPDLPVRLQACAGLDALAQAQLQAPWTDAERTQSPIVRAMQEGRTRLDRHAAGMPASGPRQRLLQARRIEATLTLPLRLARGERPFGAISVGTLDPGAFNADEVKLLEELASDLSYGIANLRSAVMRREVTQELRRSLEDTIGVIAATVESRDPYTAGHQRRVARIAAAIGREMGLAPEVIEGLHFGALIHDVGKIQVPAELLVKPSHLTALELALIKTHARAGYDIVKNIRFPWPIADMVHQHHERLDGSGYPQGLQGEAISLEARILAIADVVEAIASHRPYRPGLGIDAALREIEDKRGRWYEPRAVDACLRLFREKGFSFEAA